MKRAEAEAQATSPAQAAVQGFGAVSDARARVLVLGTMPGVVSLAAGRYYANPRNAFWPIMAALYGIDAQADYDIRLAQLRDAGVALWDVLAECERPGSLDAAIVAGSARANDFAAFLAAHPAIERIAFNGAKAAALFKRHALPQLAGLERPLCYLSLPSTSPAHAAQPLAAKLAAWRALAQA